MPWQGAPSSHVPFLAAPLLLHDRLFSGRVPASLSEWLCPVFQGTALGSAQDSQRCHRTRAHLDTQIEPTLPRAINTGAKIIQDRP